MNIEGVLVSHVFVELFLPSPSFFLFVKSPFRSLVSFEDQNDVDYSECLYEEAKAKFDIVKLRDREA